ncbi:MAG: DUF2188 domain-containing protein [Chloroflexi bacterium]|nr:DUF2188 domain-containing protein [Chloroflexota bacterium]
MSRKGNQHVTPHPDGWAVMREGSVRPSSVCPTQRDAVDRAREIARNQGTELLIHGRNGQIRERDSHGHDPCPPKDKR